MATYSAGVALAFDYEVANGTTGSYSPGGDDRAVFGTIACGNFGGLPTITELRHGGSGGTVITRIGSDLTCFGGNGAHGIFGIAPGPTGSTTLFGDWAATPLQSAIAALHYTGVDQTTPFSGAVDATPTLVGGVTTTVASVTVTGCTAGQTIIAAVTGLSDNVTLSAFTAVSGTTLRVSDVTGTFCGVAMLEKVATGSSETLSVNVNCGSSGGLYWSARGIRVNDAAGGASAITPAAGAATASALAGSSTASSAITGASGAATASTLAGSSVARAAITPASGSATAGSMAGSAAARASITGASGAATASTVAASSTARSAITAANGVATTSTLSSGDGPSSFTPAAGVATAGVLAGSATARASFVVSAGAATTSSLSGLDATAPAATGADGAGTPQRKRRRPVDNSPEVAEPAPVALVRPQPVAQVAPTVTPAPEPVQPKLAPLMRQLVELREIVVQQQEKPKARTKKEQKRQAQLEKQLQEAIAQSQELEDDYQAAAAAAELLLMG